MEGCFSQVGSRRILLSAPPIGFDFGPENVSDLILPQTGQQSLKGKESARAGAKSRNLYGRWS
jgi:hypothetical protein